MYSGPSWSPSDLGPAVSSLLLPLEGKGERSEEERSYYFTNVHIISHTQKLCPDSVLTHRSLGVICGKAR